MAFIKVQKLVRREDGSVAGGSASIIDTEYVPGPKYHSKQHVRERLGKVVYLSEDKKQGVFLSPTRGLVAYDVVTDTFTQLDADEGEVPGSEAFPPPMTYTVFGDGYMLLMLLKKEGLLDVFRSVFPEDKDYERLLCHVLHDVLKDGGNIECEDFLAKSFAAYVLPDVSLSSLSQDTAYFRRMGKYDTRLAFFRPFIAFMRKENPDFGRACCVRFASLLEVLEAANPFLALSRPEEIPSVRQPLLMLVMDGATGLPVWFEMMSENTLDIAGNVGAIIGSLARRLHIGMASFVLKEYATEELLEAFPEGSPMTMVCRMPNRDGFPYKTLYRDTKDSIDQGKYHFLLNNRIYFGAKREMVIEGYETYTYVYVDKFKALSYYRDYLAENEEDFALLRDREKDWLAVQGGYFVLISNVDKTPEELLTYYLRWTEPETAFRADGSSLRLPEGTDTTIGTMQGKILHDIAAALALRLLRSALAPSGLSVSKLIGTVQALMCCQDRDGNITVDTAGKQVREYYDLLGLAVPAHLDGKKFMTDILGLKG